MQMNKGHVDYIINGAVKEIDVDNKEILLSSDGMEIGVSVCLVSDLNKIKKDEDISLFVRIDSCENEIKIKGFSKKIIMHYIYDRLCSVSEIGVKEAGAMIDFFSEEGNPIEKIEKLITDENWQEIAKVPGVGEDIAKNLVSELRGQKKSEFDQTTVSFTELNNLIGLDNVKREIKELIFFVEEHSQSNKTGLPKNAISYHLVFTGNPGTGKNTVAQIVAELYKEIGILSKGHVIETNCAGLVAQEDGQTAEKTKEVIKSAVGGVLFINDAYTLLGENFGQEAIDTLLKEMEDNQDLVVIVAGYTKQMESFVHSNPGLEARFNRTLHFDDYLPEEMLSILVEMCSKDGYEVSSGAMNVLRDYFKNVNSAQIGNGRGVRTIYEKIIADHKTSVISAEDVKEALGIGE